MKTVKFIRLTVILMCFLTLTCSVLGVVYVNKNATGANNGNSWADAYTSITLGINNADIFDEEVWVAKGTYYEAIVMKSGVALYGGFYGTEIFCDQRNWVTNVTTIDGSTARGGSPAYHVVTMDTIIYSVLDGFTITGGQANGDDNTWNTLLGGGIYCWQLDDTNAIRNNTIRGNAAIGSYRAGGGISCCCYSSPSITDNVISGNVSYSSDSYCAAAGLHIWHYSSPSVTNNIFSGNTATGGGAYSDGGAINISGEGCSPLIAYNTIVRNSATNGAGISCWYSASPTITNNLILANIGNGSGGGIHYSYSLPIITNNKILRNSAGYGGGIYGGGTSFSSPVIKENTISGNNATFAGGGILCDASSPNLSNNIILGNSTSGMGGGIHCKNFVLATIKNNTIMGNRANAGGGVYCFNESSPAIKNNIFSNNNKFDIYEGDVNSDPLVSYNDFNANMEGVYYNENTTPYTIVSAMDTAIPECSNNIGLNPLFVGDTLSGGRWSAAAVYNSATFQTTLTDSSAVWTPDEHAGRFLNPDTVQNKQFYIVSNTQMTITVWGDITTIAHNGDYYKIYDYHLQNLYDGYTADSPCIDAGDPADDYSNEPEPNGNRINQGNYGNTAEAALSAPNPQGPPSKPTGLRAIGGANSILLLWNPNLESDIAGYNVYRDEYSTGIFMNKLNTALIKGTSYNDSAVIIGKTYYYKISAVDDDLQESPKSDAVSGTTGDITVTMPDYRGPAGADVYLKINCAYATGITGNGIDFRVTYNKNILTPIELQKTVLTQDFTFADNIPIADGQINISGVSAAGATITGEGHLLNIKFHVSAAAEMLTTGTHTFVLVKMYNTALQPLNVDYNDTALFTVAQDYILGDVNGDGVIDSVDALMALQAALGQRTLSDVEFYAVDINGDGKVDTADVTLILRLAVGLPINPSGGTGGGGVKAKSKAKSDYEPTYLAFISNYYASPGQSINIPVQLDNVKGIAGIKIYVNYDPHILQLQNVTKTTLTNSFTLNYVSSPGVVKIALSAAQDLPVGLGGVANIEFKVIGSISQSTALTISNYKLSGKYGDDLSWSTSVNISNGSVQILGPSTSAKLWHLYE